MQQSDEKLQDKELHRYIADQESDVNQKIMQREVLKDDKEMNQDLSLSGFPCMRSRPRTCLATLS
jgi:hypothetical protein